MYKYSYLIFYARHIHVFDTFVSKIIEIHQSVCTILVLMILRCHKTHQHQGLKDKNINILE